jgi:Fe-Mn family superoxide dismutase
MTRRDAIKMIGRAAAMIGLAGVKKAWADGSASATGTQQPFVLPRLNFGFDALEPQIDAQTMEIHYTKHHAAYIKNANAALEGHPELAGLTGEQILSRLGSVEEPLRSVLRNNVGGHVNHCFWWSILSAKGGGEPTGELADAMFRRFDSFDSFKRRFKAAATNRFGSGWEWLSYNKAGQLIIHSTPNQDSVISEGQVPIIGLDVWEHAYYLRYQNLRADYVDAFFEVVDWDQAARNFAAAKAAA